MKYIIKVEKEVEAESEMDAVAIYRDGAGSFGAIISVEPVAEKDNQKSMEKLKISWDTEQQEELDKYGQYVGYYTIDGHEEMQVIITDVRK